MLQPAHYTKHVHSLNYGSLVLQQDNNGLSNGTALWLGAQCLSAYLFTLSPPKNIIELGSGIGLTALLMSSLGCNVLATDIPHVIDAVLSPNISSNRSPASGTIQVRELDWTVPPEAWIWNNPSLIASASLPSPDPDPHNLLAPPFDLICSADTVYTPSLIQPLLRTFHALCTLSDRKPPVYLCLERRDPLLVDCCLSDAHDIWGFNVERIPHRKLVKAMHKAALNWPKEEWEGIEIWKLTLPRT